LILEDANASRIILIRLGQGDDIYESLLAVAKKKKIRSGLIISGVGSVSKYHYHVVKTINIPILNEYTRGEKALDVLCIQGMIMDEQVHAHITLSDIDNVIGGHMEKGCKVLTFCVITVVDLSDCKISNWDAS